MHQFKALQIYLKKFYFVFYKIEIWHTVVQLTLDGFKCKLKETIKRLLNYLLITFNAALLRVSLSFKFQKSYFLCFSLSGGINCINWHNSIEFKFYGNQFNSIVHADFYFSLNAFSILSSFQSIPARIFPNHFQ